MNHNQKKYKEAIRIITSCAKDYNKILKGNNYIFIFKNRTTNTIEYFESIFLAHNFQHLTGIEFVDKNGCLLHNPNFFYHKCINSTIKESEIRFKSDGTTELKLKALPLIINFLKSSKMTAIYNSAKPKLSIDRLAGTTNFCLGFTKDKKYYVPSSCLFEDIRNLSDTTYQILAIFSKPATKATPIYKDACYVAKGVNLHTLMLTSDLSSLIDIQY